MNDMPADTPVICANPQCNVAEDGRCIEGLDFDKCPNYGHPIELNEDAPEPEEETQLGTALPGADTLTLEQASQILCSRDAKTIAIIGPKGAGKTSLIASLYDLFQEGPVENVEYARSNTLHAFELACHDARAASRRAVPEMERTGHGEVRFYHLDLAGGSAEDGLALLMGDRAGEEYRAAGDDAHAATFPEVSRADTLTVLIDGQRLLDAGARHNLRSEITMTLQALHEGGSLGDNQQLVIVLTKIDAVQSSPLRERAEKDFKSIHEQLTKIFGSVFRSIEVCTVAASPKDDAVVRGTGIGHLMNLWLQDRRPPKSIPFDVPRAPRAFARLTELTVANND
jgi:hypothetical protein